MVALLARSCTDLVENFGFFIPKIAWHVIVVKYFPLENNFECMTV